MGWGGAILSVLLLLLMSQPAVSQSRGITLNVVDRPISSVLPDVESQGNISFLYNRNQVDVSRKVTVKVTDVQLAEALDNLFAGTGIIYTIDRDQVILKAAPAARDVSGTVLDEDGNPIPGAAVMVKGTDKGVITDIDGRYIINVRPGDVLEFSSLGYEQASVTVTEKTQVDVTLGNEMQFLEQSVVIGYGSMSKKDLTGSVSTISSEVVTDRKVSQLSMALQGSIPGVSVTRDNNAPGAQSTIRVRGITTIGDSDPLVIVDGVPADNINDVNPNDVENLTVLKDAASASIYGARAAAGVILITTKRAKENKISLDYTFEYGFDTPTSMPEYVGPVRFMEMVNELKWNDAGNGQDRYPVYPQTMVETYMQMNAERPDEFPVTDWKSLLLKKTAPKQMHVFSISGGTDRIRTKATFGYDKSDGLYENRSYERFTVRMNNDITITKWLSAAFDINVKRSSSLSPVANPVDGYHITPGIYAAKWQDGRIASGKDGSNPYAALMYGGTNTANYNQVGGKIALYVTPVKGLKISAVLAPTYNDSRTKKFAKRVEWYEADDPTRLGGVILGHNKTSLNESRDNDASITTQLIANYDNTFGRHTISLMAGYEDNYFLKETLGASRDNYSIMDYPYLDRGPEDYQYNTGNAYHRSYRSFFGRVMYNFGGKYLLQANVRWDSSSRFAPGYRTGFFPSVSGGWVITEEKFFKNWNVRPLTFLKVRASYGLLGNDRVGNYPYLPLMNYSDQLFWQGGEPVSDITAAQWQYAIRDISWETTKTFGVGVDATFFRNRLRFTADYFYKITKDMLLSVDIPDYVGFDNPEQNTGKMKTTGFELELGWSDVVGDWSYGVSAHLSDYESKMGWLGGTQFLGDQVKMIGSYFNEWYGYRSDGIFQTQEEIDNYPVMNNSVKPGDIKYLKADPNDKTPLSPDKDRVLLGNSLPRYQYGATINVGWKGIDLNVVMQGVGHRLCRITPTMVAPYKEGWGNIPAVIDGKYWSMDNTPEQNLAAEYPRLTYSQRDYNYALSDFWLFDGAYFRLKNITLGYTFPAHLTEKIRIKRLRLYVSANDVACFSRFPKGWDPEVGSTSYPITTSVVGGITVNF